MVVCIASSALNPYNSLMGKYWSHSEEAKAKISAAQKGVPSKNRALAKMGSKNPMWVGDKVSYHALHGWVRRRLLKPELCPTCNIRPAYDLANKGIYDRNLDNWEYLCRRCHMEKDGRLDKFFSEENYAKIGKSLRGHPKFYKGDKFDKESKTW